MWPAFAAEIAGVAAGVAAAVATAAVGEDAGTAVAASDAFVVVTFVGIAAHWMAEFHRLRGDLDSGPMMLGDHSCRALKKIKNKNGS